MDNNGIEVAKQNRHKISQLLSEYLIRDSIPIKQDKYGIIIIGEEKNKKTQIELSIPDDFKTSAFCQTLISFAYSDEFLAKSATMRQLYGKSFKRFFRFLENSSQRNIYAHCVSLGDLPYTIIHEFNLSISAVGTTPQTVLGVQGRLVSTIVKTINDLISNSYEKEAEHLSQYISKKHLPTIICDDRGSVQSLSQIFIKDQLTGNPIECPYLDSDLVKSLREFCAWYLGILQERRLFLREIKLADGRSLFQTLLDNLKNGTWSIDKPPVSGIGFEILKKYEFETRAEWSELYARLHIGISPTPSELADFLSGKDVNATKRRLIWLEPLVANKRLRNSLSQLPTNYSPEKTIENLNSYVIKNKLIRPRSQNPHMLTFALRFAAGQIENIATPVLSIAELIFPSPTESRLMSWLLASDCIQISNQDRLRLSDHKILITGEATSIASAIQANSADPNLVGDSFIQHHKGRSNQKKWNTRLYPKHSVIRRAYDSWATLLQDAQPWAPTDRRGFWFTSDSYNSGIAAGDRRTLSHLLFACVPNSLTNEAWMEHQPKEPVEKSAILWLLSQEIKQVSRSSKASRAARAEGKSISYITISANAVRESRIILEESFGKSDAERARYDAHGEAMSNYYRQRGMAKERILMCMRGNIQIADKMIEEALAFIDRVELVSLAEVTKYIHGKLFDVTDAFNCIEDLANQPEKFVVTAFGGFHEKSAAQSLKLINDEKTAWMLLCYIHHVASEIERIEINHDEQVIKWLFEHAVYEILFERFPPSMRKQAECRFLQHRLPFPPIH